MSALFRPALRLAFGEPGIRLFRVRRRGRSTFLRRVPGASRGDVLRTLVTNAATSQWARHIAYLEKAQIVGDRLCLSMRRPARFYPDMLRTVDFAPTHPDGLGQRAVPNRCRVRCRMRLLPPDAEPLRRRLDERPELVFRLQTDVDGAPDRFLRGESDITCSTAFPLDRLDEWRGSDSIAPGAHRDLHAGGAQPVRRRAAGRSVPAEGDARLSRPRRDRSEFPWRPAARLAQRGVAPRAGGRTSRRGCASAITTSIRIGLCWSRSACSGAIGWEYARNSSSETMRTGKRTRRMVLCSAISAVQPSVRLLRPVCDADGGLGL